ncbi:hypothetical protein DDB_G0287179 [Dictyostelium discoideum AX4]|uniref:Uncharacterized protein n=1 Tax=Dictyostelium discoideum TaxID=44689 RepID=Q54KQ0_DICDI|nr:hypothetical protein DDB_G0287179 [Dictyostelium discoideum AX4]EAL63864.1 hypothetical protein DDB_G0287179 [Dictyostelium discoideum AX4]|eukprot:XP_637380.1 hypothetical protein DDB_G0287179 [Dictyostelium discoideum AX4]
MKENENKEDKMKESLVYLFQELGVLSAEDILKKFKNLEEKNQNLEEKNQNLEEKNQNLEEKYQNLEEEKLRANKNEVLIKYLNNPNPYVSIIINHNI